MTQRTIPEIRQRLFELAIELDCPELSALAEETRRRPYVRRAPIAARKVTPELERRVISYARRNPQQPMRTIGRRFGIDQGRVSEILAGKRGE